MSVEELDSLISSDLQAFQLFVQSNYDECSSQPVTSADLAEFGRQAYYAFNSIKENVINYLNQK